MALGILVSVGISTGSNFLLSKWTRPQPPPVSKPANELEFPVTPIRSVCGKRRVPGSNVWANGVFRTPGDRDPAWLWLIQVISEGACEGIEKVWIDGNEIPLTRVGNKLTPSSGTYKRRTGDPSELLEIYEYFDADGTQGTEMRTEGIPATRMYSDTEDGTKTTDPDEGTEWYHDLQEGSTTEYQEPQLYSHETKPWTSAHRLNGLSYVGIKLFQPYYQSQRPQGTATGEGKRIWQRIPRIEYLVKGKKIRWPGQSTPKYTENPIAWLYWYDTERRGIDAAKIDTASFDESFNKCDEDVTIKATDIPDSHAYLRNHANGTRTTKRYFGGLIFESGQESDEVYARIRSCSTAYRYQDAGKIHYRVDFERASSQTLEAGDFVSIQQVSPWPAVDARINDFNATLAQSERNGFKSDTVRLTDDPAKARDGKELSLDVRLDGVYDELVAARLLYIMLRHQRETLTCQATVGRLDGMTHLSAKPGDVWTVTHPLLGLTAQRMELVEIAKSFVDGTADVSLKLLDSGVYADTIVLPQIRPRPVRFFDDIEAPDVTSMEASSHATKLADGAIINHLTVTCDPVESLRTDFEYRVSPAFGLPSSDTGAVKARWARLRPFTIGAVGSGADFTTSQSQRFGWWLNFQWGPLFNDGGVRGPDRTEAEARALGLQMQRNPDDSLIGIRDWRGSNGRLQTIWRFGAFSSGRVILGVDEINAAGTGITSGVYNLTADQIANWKIELRDSSGATLVLDMPTTAQDPTEPYQWDAPEMLAFLQAARANGRTVDVSIVDSSLIEGADQGWQPMTGTGSSAEVSPVDAGEAYEIRAQNVSSQGARSRYSRINYRLPRFLTPEGVTIYVGEAPPNNELGENGDVFLHRGGNVWYRVEGVWIDSGRPAGGQQGFVTFEIPASETVERPYPNIVAVDGTVAYNLATGQQWLRVRGVWLYKGDLTGPQGQRGAGVVEWDATRPPRADEGENGDIWRLRTGAWYRKIEGVWVLQDGAIGRNGTRVIAIDGEGPPERPDSYDPPAENDDLAFAAGSMRFYHLVNGVWIELADLSPQRTFVFSASQEQEPTFVTLPEINQVRDGDEARNSKTGEIWRASRSGPAISAITWTLVGDATVNGGFQIGSADPPTEPGTVFGEVFVSTTSDKRYVWTRMVDATTMAVSGSWVHNGYIHASQWIVTSAIPRTGTPGDCYLHSLSGDTHCVRPDGTVPDIPDGNIKDIVPAPSPTYIVPDISKPVVYFTGSRYNGGPNPNGFGKVNDGWIDLTGRYGVKENSATLQTGEWPVGKTLPGHPDIYIRTTDDPDNIQPPLYSPSRLIDKPLYYVIVNQDSDDNGEVWYYDRVLNRMRQSNISLVGTVVISPGTLTQPTFTARNISFSIRSDGTVTAALSWTGSNAVGFDVRYRIPGEQWQPETTVGGTTVRFHRINTVLGTLARNHTFSGLRPSTTYEFAVRPVGANDVGTWEPVTTTTRSIPRPVAPIAVTASESTSIDGRVNVDWSNPSAWRGQLITEIVVELTRGRVGFSVVATKREPAGDEHAVFDDVAAGSYRARVYARNPSGTGASSFSPAFTVVRTPAPSPDPTPVVARYRPYPVSITSARAGRFLTAVIFTLGSYTHRPNGRATGFEWRIRQNNPQSSPWQNWRPIGLGVTNLDRAYLTTENVRYRLEVRAVNAAGASTTRARLFTARHQA